MSAFCLVGSSAQIKRIMVFAWIPTRTFVPQCRSTPQLFCFKPARRRSLEAAIKETAALEAFSISGPETFPSAFNPRAVPKPTTDRHSLCSGVRSTHCVSYFLMLKATRVFEVRGALTLRSSAARERQSYWFGCMKVRNLKDGSSESGKAWLDPVTVLRRPFPLLTL